MSEITIYVEGGGNSGHTKAAFRQGFGRFLSELRGKARSKGIRWDIVARGPRDRAHAGYQASRQDRPDAFSVLLVDAEGPVTGSPVEHLKHGDGWGLSRDDDGHCHLMVQVMESWLIADPDKLAEFYGLQFNRNAIPRRDNVEDVPKDDVLCGLTNATARTRKGRYHKTKHGFDLLGRIRPDRVRRAARHCDRLFATIQAVIEGT